MSKGSRIRTPAPDQAQRNKVRGAIGAARAHSIKGSGGSKEEAYREKLRKVLLDARPSLSPEARRSFVDWFENIASAAQGRARTAAARGLSRLLIDGPRISIASEIDWLIARLQPHAVYLREFRQHVSALDRSFWSGDLTDCAKQLDEIEFLFGESIWLLETRLFFCQLSGGLEAQKAYLATVKEKYKSGLPAYIAHFASIRNEDRSTVRLFRDDAAQRIKSSKLSEGATRYLLYRICDEFDGTDLAISQILRGEQGQSIIDIYETTVDIFQRLVKAGRQSRHTPEIARLTTAWSEFDDFRLSKLRLASGLSVDALPVRSVEPIDWYLSGKMTAGRRAARNVLAECPTDVWAGIEEAFANSYLGLEPRSSGGPWRYVVNLLADCFTRNAAFESSQGALVKYCRNIRTLPTATALLDFAYYINASASNPQLVPLTPCLNTEAISVYDNLWVTSSRELKCDLNISPEVRSLFEGRSDSQDDPLDVGNFIEAIRHQSKRSSSAALDCLAPLQIDHLKPALRGLVANLRIDAALDSGEIVRALSYCAAEAAISPHVRGILPVEAVIGDRSWGDLAASPEIVDVAICLDTLLRRTDDDLRATHLRFAFEDFLASVGVGRPSELTGREISNSNKIVYFLRYVCIPQVMDLAGIFADSESLTAERVLILDRLAEIDSANEEAYSLEYTEIVSKRLIQEGLQIVDSSRVHVDTVAIGRWASQRYSESFDRYRDLVEAGIGVAENFDTILTRALKSKGPVAEYFEVPNNEADSLLLDIVLAIKVEFLNNSEHGLHFYLGKRIRHGTVTGQLRGPLEQTGLVTRRVTEGGHYRENETWIPQFKMLSEHSPTVLNDAFSEFSSKYDDLVERLKGEFLHIYSKEKPLGIFDITVSPIAYHIIRSAAQTDLSFDGFVRSCFSILWAGLDPSFSRARELIGQEMKAAAVTLLDELNAAVRSSVEHDDVYHQFGASVRASSVDVQRQFDEMAEWFRRYEVEQASHFFELPTLIDIAIQSALKTLKGFNPTVVLNISGNVKAPSSALVIVADVIFIILDNIFRRANAGLSPTVTLNCRFNPSEDVLVIDVVNPVGVIDRAEFQKRLDAIKAKIDTGDIKSGAQKDSGSGLLKIAALTKQSDNASISFGFEGARDFRTTVKLSVITTSTDHDEAEGDY